MESNQEGTGLGLYISKTIVEYAKGKELSPELTQALVTKAGKILHLSHFEMSGISLQMHDLEVSEGQLTLQAVANVTQFPSV